MDASIPLKLILAAILGGIIGIEREIRDKPAGLRTNSLPNKAYLARPHPAGGPDQVLKIDWFGIRDRGDTLTNYQVFPGDRTCEKFHRVLLGVGPYARTQLAEVELSELLATIAKGGARFGISVQNRTGFDVVHEDVVLGTIKNRPIARFRYPQRLSGALALGDVLAQPGVRIGYFERHGIERAAQSTKLIGSL